MMKRAAHLAPKKKKGGYSPRRPAPASPATAAGAAGAAGAATKAHADADRAGHHGKEVLHVRIGSHTQGRQALYCWDLSSHTYATLIERYIYVDVYSL